MTIERASCINERQLLKSEGRIFSPLVKMRKGVSVMWLGETLYSVAY